MGRQETRENKKKKGKTGKKRKQEKGKKIRGENRKYEKEGLEEERRQK